MNVEQAREVLNYAQGRKDARQSVGCARLLEAAHVMSAALTDCNRPDLYPGDVPKLKRFVIKDARETRALKSLQPGAYFELDGDVWQVVTESDRGTIPIWAVRLRSHENTQPFDRSKVVRVLRLVSGVFE